MFGLIVRHSLHLIVSAGSLLLISQAQQVPWDFLWIFQLPSQMIHCDLVEKSSPARGWWGIQTGFLNPPTLHPHRLYCTPDFSFLSHLTSRLQCDCRHCARYPSGYVCSVISASSNSLGTIYSCLLQLESFTVLGNENKLNTDGLLGKSAWSKATLWISAYANPRNVSRRLLLNAKQQ